jgi:hypothetical protein
VIGFRRPGFPIKVPLYGMPKNGRNAEEEKQKREKKLGEKTTLSE